MRDAATAAIAICATEQANQLLTSALACAEALGLDAEVAAVECELGDVAERGDDTAAIRHYRAAVAREPSADLRRKYQLRAADRSLRQLSPGPPGTDEARRAHDRWTADADDHGLIYQRLLARVIGARLARLEGRYEDVIAIAEEFESIAGTFREITVRIWAAAEFAEAYTRLGSPDRAETLLDATEKLAGTLPLHDAALFRIERARIMAARGGDAAAAQAEVDAAIEMSRTSFGPTGRAGCWPPGDWRCGRHRSSDPAPGLGAVQLEIPAHAARRMIRSSSERVSSGQPCRWR